MTTWTGWTASHIVCIIFSFKMIYFSSGPAWHLYCQHLVQLLTWTLSLFSQGSNKDFIMSGKMTSVFACWSYVCVYMCQCLRPTRSDKTGARSRLSVGILLRSTGKIYGHRGAGGRSLRSMSSLCCEHVCCGINPLSKGIKRANQTHAHESLESK